MIAGHMFGACLPTFGNCADRYCLSGYGGGGKTMEEMLDLSMKVEGLDGLELVGNWHVNDANIRQVAKMFRDRGLKICMLVPDLWTQAKWGSGSLAAPDAPTRAGRRGRGQERSLDWAAELGCPYMDVWPGQDGYDYSFQADYIEAWKWLRDGLVGATEHNPKVRRAGRVQAEGAAHALLRQQRGQGAAAAAGHRPGRRADGRGPRHRGRRVHRRGGRVAGRLRQARLPAPERQLRCLGRRHDGRLRTSGRVPGAGLLAQAREYQGWLTLDIFPYREDGVRAAIQCKKWMEAFFDGIDQVGLDACAEVIRSADACDAVDLVRRALRG